MTIFAATGQEMKLVMDEIFITKKMKIWRFWANCMLCTSKKSLEHVEFRFRLKKYDFLEKKFFFLFLSKGWTLWFCTSEISFLIFWNFQKLFMKNGFNGTFRMLKGIKSWIMSSIRASTEDSWWIVYMCRHKVPPLM